MYIVYTEIHENGKVERWYYGAYETANRANEVAIQLGAEYPIFHCVCKAEDADKLHIQNMYRD